MQVIAFFFNVDTRTNENVVTGGGGGWPVDHDTLALEAIFTSPCFGVGCRREKKNTPVLTHRRATWSTCKGHMVPFGARLSRRREKKNSTRDKNTSANI